MVTAVSDDLSHRQAVDRPDSHRGAARAARDARPRAWRRRLRRDDAAAVGADTIANLIEENPENRDVQITVGSKNFTEQLILGEIYAQALRRPDTTHGTEPMGDARYVRRAEPEVAEVAIAVVDHWHGHGVRTPLLHELGERAREEGIRHFQATCLADNAELIDLPHRLGTAREVHPEAGLVELTVGLPEKVLPASELQATLRPAASRKLEAVRR